MSNNAGVEQPKFPMRVSDFLTRADRYLDRGDIILTRGNYLSSRVIRWIIGSFFSHAAMVFLLPQQDNGFNNTFMLESMPTGIGLAKLKSYIGGQNPSEDVAILRMEGEGINEAYFGRAINLGLSLFFSLRRKWSPKGRSYSSLKQWVPSQFICSGFIQYGFVEALRRKGIDPTQVIFKQSLSPNDRDGLLAISPEDIAKSNKPKWLYAIRRGWVYEVKSFDEAQSVILGRS
jgi:hypothetical protein